MPYDIDALVEKAALVEKSEPSSPPPSLADVVRESMRNVLRRAVVYEPYAAREVCQHAFAYDTGVCMACGVSVASARLASAKPPVNQPIDPAGWDKLRAALDKCEPTIPSQPMSKTEAQLHHLTSVLGSREKALDAWKAAHLGARAIKNNRAHADYLDACDMEREIDALSDAQTLQHAMSRPLAAEKSMRAQLLLRDDD